MTSCAVRTWHIHRISQDSCDAVIEFGDPAARSGLVWDAQWEQVFSHPIYVKPPVPDPPPPPSLLLLMPHHNADCPKHPAP